jgi:hypothetical protein
MNKINWVFNGLGPYLTPSFEQYLSQACFIPTEFPSRTDLILLPMPFPKAYLGATKKFYDKMPGHGRVWFIQFTSFFNELMKVKKATTHSSSQTHSISDQVGEFFIQTQDLLWHFPGAEFILEDEFIQRLKQRS